MWTVKNYFYISFVLFIVIIVFVGTWLHESSSLRCGFCAISKNCSACPVCGRVWGYNETTKLSINSPGHITIDDDPYLSSNYTGLPTIFVITPTYKRHTQKAELTRLCQTFLLVKNLHWIVIEDADEKTPLVARLLARCGVTFTLLNRKSSLKVQPKRHNKNPIKNRGAEQRNIGLDWLRETYKLGEMCGVVYFGDDDNTYDVRLFEEMRYTKKVSVWPVGLVGGLLAEGPICANGKVINWHVSWSSYRKFPLDMAAFAFNLDVILSNPEVRLDPRGELGHLETRFLSTITTVEELEPKANGCTEIYVWHTQTMKPNLRYEKKNPTTLEVKR